MWMLQVVRIKTGIFISTIREIDSSVYTPINRENEGSYVYKHASRKEAFIHLHSILNEEYDISTSSAPTPSTPPQKRQLAIQKIHMKKRGGVKSMCGVTEVGPFSELRSDISCGRCLRVLGFEKAIVP